MNMIRACILIPYYGRWPSYFDLYLQSCKNNTFIDFVFITDLPKSNNWPQNVKKIDLSLRKVEELISQKLGVVPNISRPYKLCDIRPAYGFLFQDYLTEYTFWGWGDIDLFYGRIDQFIAPEFLENYDVISTRKEWVSGGFSLFRNTESINTLFMYNDDWKEVFSTEKHYSFGECGRKWDEVRAGADILKMPLERVNMTYLVKKYSKEGHLKAFFKTFLKESIHPDEVIEVTDRVMSSNGQEYLLYHMVSEKKRPQFFMPNWESVPERYFITRTGFYLSEEMKHLKRIDRSRKIRAIPKALQNNWNRVIAKLT